MPTESSNLDAVVRENHHKLRNVHIVRVEERAETGMLQRLDVYFDRTRARAAGVGGCGGGSGSGRAGSPAEFLENLRAPAPPTVDSPAEPLMLLFQLRCGGNKREKPLNQTPYQNLWIDQPRRMEDVEHAEAYKTSLTTQS